MDNINFITLPLCLAGIKSVNYGILAIAETEEKTIDTGITRNAGLSLYRLTQPGSCLLKPSMTICRVVKLNIYLYIIL